MRKLTLSTLEVFSYACVEQSATEYCDEKAIQRIESLLIKDESLGRLSALILQKALANNQLDWFSETAQRVLKTTATKLVVDVAAKHYFIKQLVPLLELNNIPVILLKGMAFNHYLYDDNAPRGVSDIDILIKPEDKERFKVVFAELARAIEIENKHAFDDLYEQTWRSKNNQHLIDVHTHLTNPILFDISTEMLWKCSMPHTAYSSDNVRLLSVEDTICHLVTHMINDTNFFHYNLIDMQKLILKQPIDVSALEKTALIWGVLNATRFVLQVAHDYLDSPLITQNTQARFLLSVRPKIASLVINKLFTLDSNEKGFRHRLQQLCCYAFVVDKWTLIFKISIFYLLGLTKALKR
jgi:hypothetical protein